MPDLRRRDDLARRYRGSVRSVFRMKPRAKIGAQIGHHQRRATCREKARRGEAA